MKGHTIGEGLARHILSQSSKGKVSQFVDLSSGAGLASLSSSSHGYVPLTHCVSHGSPLFSFEGIGCFPCLLGFCGLDPGLPSAMSGRCNEWRL